jgi:hypothetical protein
MMIKAMTTVTEKTSMLVVLPRLRRYGNSCIIREGPEPLAVAEYLLDGLLRMSDRDIELQNGVLCLPEAMLELHVENCISMFAW